MGTVKLSALMLVVKFIKTKGCGKNGGQKMRGYGAEEKWVVIEWRLEAP